MVGNMEKGETELLGKPTNPMSPGIDENAAKWNH